MALLGYWKAVMQSTYVLHITITSGGCTHLYISEAACLSLGQSGHGDVTICGNMVRAWLCSKMKAAQGQCNVHPPVTLQLLPHWNT